MHLHVVIAPVLFCLWLLLLGGLGVGQSQQRSSCVVRTGQRGPDNSWLRPVSVMVIVRWYLVFKSVLLV